MPFDFKKEYKEFYMPKNKPEIVNVPKANYVAVRGKGDPNEEGGEYKSAIGVLYAVAYTLKMSYKTDYRIEGFHDYVVPPLEGFWWQEGVDGIDYSDKSAFCWISVIRLPDFITKKDFDWAVETAAKKKKLDCSKAEFLTIDEGLCVQIMHIGSFDNEPATVELMNRYIAENRYENDFSDTRIHHEIYLSDARKVAPEKWKTVIRHPIRKKKINITFRKLKDNEITTAISLAWEVFSKYESPDYSPEGTEEFHKCLNDEKYLAGIEYYGAFDSGKLVGMVGIRKEKCHICFFFVDGKYHRLGIGTSLFEYMKADYPWKNITLNSSPYGVPFYKSLGFIETDSEQTVNGIRFTPMEKGRKKA